MGTLKIETISDWEGCFTRGHVDKLRFCVEVRKYRLAHLHQEIDYAWYDVDNIPEGDPIPSGVRHTRLRQRPDLFGEYAFIIQEVFPDMKQRGSFPATVFGSLL